MERHNGVTVRSDVTRRWNNCIIGSLLNRECSKQERCSERYLSVYTRVNAQEKSAVIARIEWSTRPAPAKDELKDGSKYNSLYV